MEGYKKLEWRRCGEYLSAKGCTFNYYIEPDGPFCCQLYRSTENEHEIVKMMTAPEMMIDTLKCLADANNKNMFYNINKAHER